MPMLMIFRVASQFLSHSWFKMQAIAALSHFAKMTYMGVRTPPSVCAHHASNFFPHTARHLISRRDLGYRPCAVLYLSPPFGHFLARPPPRAHERRKDFSTCFSADISTFAYHAMRAILCAAATIIYGRAYLAPRTAQDFSMAISAVER